MSDNRNATEAASGGGIKILSRAFRYRALYAPASVETNLRPQGRWPMRFLGPVDKWQVRIQDARGLLIELTNNEWLDLAGEEVAHDRL